MPTLAAHGVDINNMHAVTQRKAGQHAGRFVIRMRPGLHENQGGLKGFQPHVKLPDWLSLLLLSDEVLFHLSLGLSCVRLRVML